MQPGLIAFLILAPIVVWVTYAIVGWLNYKENPLYWRDQKAMLEVGSYRWMMLSPKHGEGHKVAVVKAFEKNRIIIDIWMQTADGGWKQLEEGVSYSVGDFFRFTDPEPNKWTECSEDLSRE